ncbi:MAG: hydrogenase maturation nickel metallochaperone HypA [Arcanobacterium sp.]|nr:hydrogenase maturation nickel metallochaperone HypA [Arcanobacterium sp.]MDY5588820.1 hydrogenase maturation nickel metallochaperone HypA [Arcanobacterium sp.]
MHELSLLASVVEVVSQAARQAHATRVRSVALDVGTLSGAIPEALYGAWPIAIAEEPLLADAELEIHEIAATVHCPHCAADVQIDEFYALTCPQCGTPTAALTHGREFAVAWVRWDEPDSLEP